MGCFISGLVYCVFGMLLVSIQACRSLFREVFFYDLVVDLFFAVDLEFFFLMPIIQIFSFLSCLKICVCSYSVFCFIIFIFFIMLSSSSVLSLSHDSQSILYIKARLTTKTHPTFLNRIKGLQVNKTYGELAQAMSQNTQW